MKQLTSPAKRLSSLSFALLYAAAAYAQSAQPATRAGGTVMLSGDALVNALRHGGYVIVMRHASSPREVPDKEHANPDNTKPERQLDETGRTTAAAMGKALRDLKIPIGEIFSSPTYRALETIRLEGLANPKPTPELGDNGQSMGITTEAQAAWLQKAVTQFPSGTNTLLVTHFPNLTRALPKDATGVEDGEALIFGPGGLVARVKIEDWAKL
jgi:phosphohistidine phosphatase SixA